MVQGGLQWDSWWRVIEQSVARRRPWAAVLGLLAAALASGWVALALLTQVVPALFPGQSVPLPEALPLEQLGVAPPSEESVFNRPIVVLLAAVDSRPGQTAGLAAVNTDTIMLARISPVAKDIRVLSVPRDLLMDVTYQDGSTGTERINSSFAQVAGARGAAAGMANLSQDLERNLGISIDYWVMVDFRGAEKVIDALGGVDLDIPGDLAMSHWWYSDDDVTHQLLDFPPGPQHLDGYHAVAFARLRAPDDDLHRIKRQQLVLEAAMKQAFAGGAMTDPLGLWNAYGSAFKTNVPAAKLPGYALLAKQTHGTLDTYSLGDPVDGVPSVEDRTLRSGAEVLVAEPAALRYWVDSVFGDDEAETNVVAQSP
jgi:LCP family protein required for cell wall assembly